MKYKSIMKNYMIIIAFSSIIPVEEIILEPEEDTEGIVDYGLYIPGSLISVFIREVDNHSFKVSLRSQDETNILPIAHAFGGGGHLKAAGFKIQGDFKTVYHNLKEHIQGYLSSQSGTPHSLSV
ncbi:MAG TPA: DHHA1 domain-containing protein [Atribacter sp.]|uniref:DHH family phosphoesterase n=1 Tax=Atribacter sp. TaxID=2847780 RepID=UPI002B7FA202|nr:DHHA1 domain-containing protein [Atribacter sp.]HQK82563.1 DHHA1 domain-containing protein [Atribacter sp.]